MKYITVAISLSDHDDSVCVLENYKVKLFYQAERVTRKKHSKFLHLDNFTPLLKIVKEIDCLVFPQHQDEKTNDILNFFKLKNVKIKKTLYSYQHHFFHAISGFYASNFQHATALIVDGWGMHEKINNVSVNEITSIYDLFYDKNSLIVKPLYKSYFLNKKLNPNIKLNEFDIKKFKEKFDFSVDVTDQIDMGFFHGIFTKYLGFNFLDNGKLMGLSSFGKSNKNLKLLHDEKNLEQFDLNMDLFLKNKNIKNWDEYSFLKYFNFFDKADIAYLVEKTLQESFKYKLNKLLSLSSCKNIIVSGGCALNVINNYSMKESFKNLNFYIDPIASDASISLGAAVYCSNLNQKNLNNFKVDSISWGPKYEDSDIIDAIVKYDTN